jgi:hypothetical protein
MTTFNVTNTRQEGEQAILFVSFNVDNKIYEETFRFPLNKNLQEILVELQKRADFYDQREVEIKEAYEKLQNDLLNETTWQ